MSKWSMLCFKSMIYETVTILRKFEGFILFQLNNYLRLCSFLQKLCKTGIFPGLVFFPKPLKRNPEFVAWEV